MRRSIALVLLPLFLLVGCTANALRTAPPLTTSEAPVAAPAAAPPEVGFGSVRVGVRWPGYQTQAIPFSAASLEVTLLKGDTSVATASIVRPATTATLARLPVGSYTVQLEARKSDQTVVADATSPITVVANRIAAASLVLTPRFAPRLDYLYPASGPAGTVIGLYGQNLWSGSTGTVSVLVDGLPVPDSLFDAGSTIYLYDLPSWAGNSATISVVVDGIPVPESRVFSRQVIHHLKLTPTSVNLATHQRQTFTATAYSSTDDSAPVSGVTFTWLLTDQFPPPEGTFGSSDFELLNGSFVARATGSVTVRAEAGGKFATASVVIDSIGAEPTPDPGPGGAAP